MDQLKLDGLQMQIKEPVSLFATQLAADLADNLVSLTIVGSSLKEDYNPSQSDINTVLVVQKQDLEMLNKLAAMGKQMGKKRIKAPILMTSEYIDRSRDVFSVEWLDFQLNHQTVLGADPFETLQFDRQHVRLQCEHEFKSVLIRLRQGYIRSANKSRNICDLLAEASHGLLPYLRAYLWLKDSERPVTAEKTILKAAEVLATPLDALSSTLQFRYAKIKIADSEVNKLFAQLYDTVEALAEPVDQLEA